MTHGRNNVCGSKVHPSVFLEILMSAAEKTSNRPWMPTLPIAVHQTYGLPIEVSITFHWEQSMQFGRIQCHILFCLPITTGLRDRASILSSSTFTESCERDEEDEDEAELLLHHHHHCFLFLLHGCFGSILLWEEEQQQKNKNPIK